MGKKTFVHLHNHTEFSMLDGMAKIDNLMEECNKRGMPAVGMTDHGNMYGASDFYHAAVDAGIKPIIGIEAYLAPGSRFDKKRQRWGDPSPKRDDVSGSGAYTHMTLWAQNETGLRNLFKLSSLASYEGQLGKWPRMDVELISQHSEGLIGASGCPSSEIQTRLRLGQRKEAYEAAGRWQDIFGKDNFYLELMDHDIDIEKRIKADLLQLGKDLGMEPVVTNDCHYVTRDQARAHEAMLCVQTGKTLSDPTRFKFDGDSYYLIPPEEIRARWDSEVPGACDNTLVITEKVEDYSNIWKFKDRMPDFDVPKGHDAESWLRHQVHKGLEWRFPDGVSREYIERANYEIDVIVQKGYPTYFLVVADLVNHAREVGIKVGPGRGSAAGALIAYALGITNIDPVEHGLLFERFLNPERPSAPDIDMDFDDRRRNEMIRYASDRWGEDKVAQVIAFGTIKTKAAIKDSARVQFGQPGYAIADRMTKALPPAQGAKDIPLHGIMDPEHPRYGEASEIRSLIESDPDIRKIYETARGFEGMIRQAGVHACAVIMSNEPLLDCVPMWKRSQDGAIITGWDYPACEDIGLLKMDFLGLRNLTVIGDALENIKANRDGEEVDLERLPLTDTAAYELLQRGDTLGVFQLDSGGMRELLKRMEPTEFNDIVASLALYRPGPMGVGAHWAYADRKNGRAPVEPIHPELDEPLRDILAETYGLIVYQEQIMQIAQKVAGYSLGQADLLRRAMGKKKPEVLAKEFDRFQSGMREREFSDQAIKVLWETILPFAGYAFNKSHAAGYGLVSYWTAYLKANYPAEYMAALLTSVGDDKDKTAIYLSDCRRLGIRVLQPDVNESTFNFAPVGKDIRFGLGAIRNVGEQPVDDIVASRDEKGDYTDFSDYLDKIGQSACTKKVTESLIKAGAFDSMGHPRKGLFLVHADAVDAVSGTKKAAAAGQFDLFAGFGADDTSEVGDAFKVQIPDEEWDKKHRLSLEREMLGLYVSGHPLDGLELALHERTDTSIATILEGELPHGKQVVIGGIIASVDRRVNKRGEPWAIVRIEDLQGGVEVLFFPRIYQKVGMDIVEDAVVIVSAHVNIRDDRMSLFGDDLSVPDLGADGVSPVFHLRLTPQMCTPELLAELKGILTTHQGSSPVMVTLDSGNKTQRLALSENLQVNASGELISELKAVFGSNCV
ncbi:MAG TPA: DNA polymerase III subunit alpha [Corynebacteriales bacterium]|nr:DNA polymerase III subunit alpha [Mycobacteriales bacterium]